MDKVNTGLLVEVYRAADGTDCTNRGASSKFTMFTLTWEGGNGPFEPAPHRPELVLREGPYGTLQAVPREVLDSGAWYMFGGNFCYTSDSRFPGNGAPIKIFDRVEHKGGN